MSDTAEGEVTVEYTMEWRYNVNENSDVPAMEESGEW